MLDARLSVLVRIEAMLAALSEELSAAERRFGWTDASRIVARALFEQMRTDVEAGKDVWSMPQYVSIVRGLDHWGISGGPLFEKAAAIGRMGRDSR